MHTDQDQDVRNMGWCDAELEGWAWINDGRDVVLNFRFLSDGGSETQVKQLHCRWARALRVNLLLGEDRGGMPTTWDARFSTMSDGSVDVLIDFAGVGTISLLCSELELQ